MGINLKATVL